MREPRKLRKVLVANRGEIAVRVIRALRERDVRAAVIYSEVDRASLPVLLADEAYCVGPAPSRESYLRGAAIVELAGRIGADGIHPGYGFLSESPDFALACEHAGLVFIGPRHQAIAAMGRKIESRKLMVEAGVPVVPGLTEPVADERAAAAAAEEIGYPIMLKASLGGGGKGMRLVRQAAELASAFRAASSEASTSFGDGSLYLEGYLERPRHVEIQVLGDHHGNLVSLGERECSLQRRHQKVVEEAPSPAVSPELRQRMGEAAVRAASAVGYDNAGTVEFLLDGEGRFYFLEMNTRLQVEHPVTEAVTGIDLVHAQLQIAEGEPLPVELLAGPVVPRGHAIEVRIYAEDPYRGFAPAPGRIDALRWPEGPGVRCDGGVYAGSLVSIHYDPLLAKLIVWGPDRSAALKRLKRALLETRIDGIATTLTLFRALLHDLDFLAGRLDIGMLDRKLASGELLSSSGDGSPAHADVPLIAAALEHADRESRNGTSGAELPAAGRRSPWAEVARREGLRGSGSSR